MTTHRACEAIVFHGKLQFVVATSETEQKAHQNQIAKLLFVAQPIQLLNDKDSIGSELA